jgi:hypothetical protein
MIKYNSEHENESGEKRERLEAVKARGRDGNRTGGRGDWREKERKKSAVSTSFLVFFPKNNHCTTLPALSTLRQLFPKEAGR